ncbi:MAG: DUF1572 family protein [Saprospiraceae bacterium]
MQTNFLTSTRKQFEYYKMLGDKTFANLSEENIHWQYNEQSNSIAIIVNHITGNMLSRWTDFLHSDGEKDWRNRDQEFESIIKTKEELLRRWEEGWACLFKALDSVNENNFDQLVYIRNIGHTIVEAVNRQLAHYAYHIGQIVSIAKMIKGEEWQSLSIAKGASKEYNKKKFEQEQKRGHFTDEFLEDKT